MACLSRGVRIATHRSLYKVIAYQADTKCILSLDIQGFQARRARCLTARCFSLTSGKCYSTTGKENEHNQSQQEHSDQDKFSGNTEESGQGDEAQYEHDIRQRILSASLPYVQELGWTKKALEAGAKDEGLPPVAHGMFPRDGVELVHHFYAKCNQELAEILASDVKEAEEKGEKLRTQQFIQNAIETRLRMIFPYMDTWPQAMALQTLPQNAVESWTNTLNLMDEIWFYAGDRSIDFNWYTKRMTLYGVYKSTEIYMLQDKSADKEDTWAFLDRRLGDFQTLAAAKKSCEQNSDVLKEAVKGFAVMGRNILGFNSRDR